MATAVDARLVGSSRRKVVYGLSCELDLNVSVRIGLLEGVTRRRGFHTLAEDPGYRYSGVYQSNLPELYVTVQLYVAGEDITLPLQTGHRAFDYALDWAEWLVLPIKYRDVPRGAQIAITVWDTCGPRRTVPVGGATISVFGKSGALRRGRHLLRLWPDREADGSTPTSTPGKSGAKDEIDRLDKLTKKYDRGEMVHVDWLDKAVLREVQAVKQREGRDKEGMRLAIEFPEFECPVVFQEKEGHLPIPSHILTSVGDFSLIPDPEMGRDNLQETKHKKLVRSNRRMDHDIKPNAAVRDQLNEIVRYPPTRSLTAEEQDLLWKFRFYLTRERKALTKFLKSIDWAVASEAAQAATLLDRWEPIDVDDALELLSPQFPNAAVRQYAVSRLARADDEELVLYLLQLVQALKYDDLAGTKDLASSQSLPPTPTVLQQAQNNDAALQEQLALAQSDSANGSIDPSDKCLETFLIARARANPVLGNYFHWYLTVEADERGSGRVFAAVKENFMRTLDMNPESHPLRDTLIRQMQLINTLGLIVREMKMTKESRPKKIKRLRQIISETESLVRFDPLPLPVDPEIHAVGVVAEKASIFKSALMPLSITFKAADDSEYAVIFKIGDDLRQDQLILQIITLMDRLLRRENLDLKLTPYKVLATSSDTGLLQFVRAVPVAGVLEEHGNLQAYFRMHHAEEGQPYGIKAEVMDTYVKSCVPCTFFALSTALVTSAAGYCVITYLLGIGDRHLDNLLLSDNGHLLHIDFGFILGRDPKPFPPPMKLCKEMVEAMGGANSADYKRFLAHCYSAFLILRRSANLILNLFALMVDANVPDIALEPDRAVAKVQEKFRLDLSEEAAVQFFQSLINESVSALFPQMVETIHKWAQYWRK